MMNKDLGSAYEKAVIDASAVRKGLVEATRLLRDFGNTMMGISDSMGAVGRNLTGKIHYRCQPSAVEGSQKHEPLDLWDEQWKPVPGFEWGYYVSNLGRVRGPRKVLKPQPQSKGYLAVKLYKRKSTKKYPRLVSRLVAVAFLGKPDHSDCEVHHKDGDIRNNHADNLEWVRGSLHSRAGIRREKATCTDS